jgi:hypothetical protein
MPPPGALRFCPSRDEEIPERENDDDDRDFENVFREKHEIVRFTYRTELLLF